MTGLYENILDTIMKLEGIQYDLDRLEEKFDDKIITATQYQRQYKEILEEYEEIKKQMD